MTVALSLHIAFLAVWSASLLAMPLLFARKAADPDPKGRQRLELAQRWLYASLMTPSALFTVGFGIWLVFERGFEGGWLPVKLALVLAMGWFHAYCGVLLGDRGRPRAEHRALYYYALLAVPTLLVVAVIALVAAKPF